MKSDNNGATRKIFVMGLAWLLLLGDLTVGILGFILYCHISPILAQHGDKPNQAGIDALIEMVRTTVLQIFPAISIILICNAVLIFLLLRELKLNADKQKTVRAGDNL
jgi:hypothetical protein